MAGTENVTRREVLEMLKLEMGMVRDGGYGASVRTPRATPTHFRDSAVCLNFGKTEDETWEACDRCWLVQFVPRQHRNRLLACHFIPLNEQGETLASLEAAGDRERTEQVLDAWLRARLAEAEREEGCAHDNESSYAEQIPRAGD